MPRIDINADAGEAPDTSADEALLAVVSSVNIACGVHAGSAEIMTKLSEAARGRGIGVGAHPGLAEGRKVARIISPIEAADAIRQQLDFFRKHSRAPLQHVKLHGALYHAGRDPRVAKGIAAAARELAIPILVAQANSPLEKEARALGVRVAAEAFLDRAYEPDGRLVSRERPGALLEDPEAAAVRAVKVVEKEQIEAVNGRDLAVHADTLCVHGDTRGALAIARAARAALEKAGVQVKPMGAP